MRKLLVIAIIALLGASANSAAAAEPLVEPAWVKANAGTPGIVFVDLRHPRAFQAGHVPGAVRTSYGRDGWRVTRNGVPGLLPETARLEALIGGLGIDNGSHVVLLPAGASAGEVGSATRIYWTLKLLGHDEVSILNGGMRAYLRDKAAPLERGPSRPRAKAFKASLRPELLATAADVHQALRDGTPLIDNRSSDKHLGINTPRPAVTRRGTPPGAVSLPAVWLTEDAGGVFRDAATLRKLYAAAGAPSEGPAITFCNTGHWASLGWFVNSEILGNRQTRLYDGSMAEWSRDPANPMERKVKLD
jgi:thiosulfate/3-mercaptopyruvate sulfurtransferase